MGHLWARAAWIGSITLLMGGLSAEPAAAAAASLTGEILNDAASVTTLSGDCSVGLFSFTSSGPATGPYPGAYTASGSLTLDPISGTITAFSEDFTITSTVTITGHKSLAAPVSALSCSGATTGTSFILFSSIPANYTATIPDGTGGTFVDQGTATVTITFVNEPNLTNGPETGFHQEFVSTGIVPGFPTNNGGTFVIGDLEAGIGNTVTWWSSQWAKINQMSGGPAPSSMKGFAGFEDMALPSPLPPLPKLCGMTWTTDTGNATPPPPSVPSEMLVIVSSQVTQNGSVISGDIKELIAVKNNPGYAPGPGHTGTGMEETVICAMP